MIGFLYSPLIHVVNSFVFVASLALAVSDNVGVALIAGVFSVVNTFLILLTQRQHKKTREDLHARRLVVVRFGDGEGGDDTVVITPEERRVLEDLRHPPSRRERRQRERDD